jgi:GNAT superfamily N-acetyltransferase
MYLHNETAFLGNTFTRPEHRRNGYHMALLAARARHAMSVGATVIYTDVEHGSQSHHNCERAGMRTVSINTIWAKDA